jgi:hypothetical protein
MTAKRRGWRSRVELALLVSALVVCSALSLNASSATAARPRRLPGANAVARDHCSDTDRSDGLSADRPAGSTPDTATADDSDDDNDDDDDDAMGALPAVSPGLQTDHGETMTALAKFSRPLLLAADSHAVRGPPRSGRAADPSALRRNHAPGTYAATLPHPASSIRHRRSLSIPPLLAARCWLFPCPPALVPSLPSISLWRVVT